MNKPRYLSKSKFKEGLDCLTKLYYTGKPIQYANQMLDDPFLRALANGGFQVGELAKYLFSDDPFEEQITIESLSYDTSLQDTNNRLAKSGKAVIAEAAFKYNNLFIRADIVVKQGNHIDLYEVKAKSFKSDNETTDDFISYKGKQGETISSEWASYLYDIAFQKYVVSKAMPEYSVNAYLVLADKSKKATIDGLNQMFRIDKEKNKIKISVPVGLKKEQLGDIVLEKLNVDSVINDIWTKYKVPSTYNKEMSFEEFVRFCEEKYVKDERVFAPLTSNCKSCPYITKEGKDDTLQSGFIECWAHHTKLSKELLKVQPLIIELWQGGVDKLINEGKYFLKNIDITDIEPKKQVENTSPGLTRLERRVMQIEKAKKNDKNYYFDKEGFEREMKSWKYPFHMIDFETSMVALPFHKNTRPYQGIAFQFSHHILYENNKIEHKNQFIHFEKGVYPNLDFIKALKTSLSEDDGTIFRYHNHENSYLRMINNQIKEKEILVGESEEKELICFIESITVDNSDKKNKIYGSRSMVDLFEVVKRYYYSPSTKGKIGLKFVLPAIINDSPFLINKYGKKGIYGKRLVINSLNFIDHQWINSEFNNDPYKTLPRVFEEYSAEDLDPIIDDFNVIADGGTALTAYNYLQYTNVLDEKRETMRDALYRYCELDTMAMIMLIEGMNNLQLK